MADPQERPATFEEVIRGIAKQQGVSPMLAATIAETESAFKPDAISPKGAQGLFQLMPETAAEMGVTDPMDPVQNITGGVKYIKLLSDKYEGDVNKVLQAYNFGMGNVDAGKPLPAETQAYVSKVMTGLSRRQREKVAQPETTPAAAPTGTPEERPGILRAMASSFDPRTETGIKNVSATVGGAVGGIPGAMLGGAAGEGFDQLRRNVTQIPGAIRDIARNVAEGYGAETTAGFKQGAAEGAVETGISGVTQGAYEVAGRALMWPITTIGKSILATKVGKTASTALKGRLEAAKTFAGETLEQAKGFARDKVATATDAAGQAASATRDAMASFVDDVRAQAQAGVRSTRRAVKGQVRTAERQGADVLAQAELDATDMRKAAQAGYDAALGQAPSQARVAETTKKVLGGLPGVAAPTGPAKRALDAAGKAIDDVAQTGPTIQAAPIKTALAEMQAKTRPDALFPSKDNKDIAKAIGFTSTGSGAGSDAAAAKAGLPTTEARLKLVKMIQEQLGLPEGHPLPGVLAQVQQAPDTLKFAEAHQLKRLLDEAVSWDRTAKRHLEGLTKGVRTVLRESLAVHEPYNAATKAYADLVPLYRRGAGKALVKAAGERPDRIAKLLKPVAPHDAQAIKDLLVSQAEAGGDAQAGLQAWDAVRSSFTYDNLLTGGPEKLSQRIQQMTTQHPEFVSTLYDDPSGQMVLSNLTQIGKAFDDAIAKGGAGVAAAKESGKALTAGVAETGEEQIYKSQVARSQATVAASRKAREANRARSVAGKQDIAAARHMGAEEIKRARASGQTAVELAQQHLDQFKNSSMNRFAAKSPEEVGADVIRAGLIPRTFWGAMSVIRLLRAPKGEDLLQAAAYSPEMTQRLVRVLNGRAPGTATTTLIRDLVGMVQGETAPAPPTETPSDGGLHLTIRGDGR